MKTIIFMFVILSITISKCLTTVREPRQLFNYYQSTRYTLPNGRLLFANLGYQSTDDLETNNLNSLPLKTNVNLDLLLNPDKTQEMSEKTTELKAYQIETTGTFKLEEGSFCRRSFDGQSGYCLLAYQCLHVIRAFRLHGIKIDVCDYRKNVPIICCPLEDKDSRHGTSKRISLKKCESLHSSLEEVEVESFRNFSGKSCVGSVPMIVGGTVTKSGEYPHMAGLGWTVKEEKQIKWGCGASLISDLFVLSAAHCTESGGVSPDIVRLGSTNINNPSPEYQDIKIKKIILHPKYRAASYYHDIGLLRLVKRAEFNDLVQPICLWPLLTLDIPIAIAIGWGRTEFLGYKSDELQQVDLKIIDQKVCKDFYKTERRLPKGIIDEQFCAGHLEGGKDTCQGDSGGGIHVQLHEINCVQFLIGITSFGKFCAAPNAPGVYTKIYSYLGWIEKYVFI